MFLLRALIWVRMPVDGIKASSPRPVILVDGNCFSCPFW